MISLLILPYSFSVEPTALQLEGCPFETYFKHLSLYYVWPQWLWLKHGSRMPASWWTGHGFDSRGVLFFIFSVLRSYELFFYITLDMRSLAIVWLMWHFVFFDTRVKVLILWLVPGAWHSCLRIDGNLSRLILDDKHTNTMGLWGGGISLTYLSMDATTPPIAPQPLHITSIFCSTI